MKWFCVSIVSLLFLCVSKTVLNILFLTYYLHSASYLALFSIFEHLNTFYKLLKIFIFDF